MNAILPPGFTLLQVTPRLDSGGVERATLDMARAAVRAGGRSIVASAGGAMLKELEGEHIVLPVHSRNPATILANAGRLARVIRERGVSLVHVRSRAPAFSALRAAKRTGIPVVATYHGIYAAPGPIKRWYNGVMTSGDLVIANSCFTRDHILAEHGVDPTRIALAPEGIDTSKFDPAAVDPKRVAAVRATWGLHSGDRRRVLLCAARLTRWKGQHVAVEAFARLRDRGSLLVLVGNQTSEDYARELIQLTDRLGVVGSVVFSETSADMPAALLAADLVLAPSQLAESFGRVVVEAAAMERPVIASAIGAHLETVVDGETGWLVPPHDIDAWARALDRVTPTGMGTIARERAVRLYGLDAMAEATFAVYRRLLMT